VGGGLLDRREPVSKPADVYEVIRRLGLGEIPADSPARLIREEIRQQLTTPNPTPGI
jgi:hypothetical protein